MARRVAVREVAAQLDERELPEGGLERACAPPWGQGGAKGGVEGEGGGAKKGHSSGQGGQTRVNKLKRNFAHKIHSIILVVCE